jgi:hypothetical protein
MVHRPFIDIVNFSTLNDLVVFQFMRIQLYTDFLVYVGY